MKNKLNAVGIVAILALGVTAPANADPHRHYYGHSRYDHRCHSGNGAVGTVAGGVGGAVLGGAIIGGPVATIAGGVGGALLGRHLDKSHTRHRSGC